MKKLIYLTLALLMLAAMAAGCAEQTPSETTEQSQQSTALSTSEATATSETAEAPLADARVRQAIAYAIDMQALIDSLMGGKAIVADSLMPNGAWKVEGLNDYAYDPEKAKQLLAEANWDPNYVLDVVYYYGDQLTVDLMTAIQAYLADVGMQMKFRMLEGDLASQLWTPPKDPMGGVSTVDWDLAYAGIAALAPQEYYNRSQTGFSSNSHTPSDKELDELIAATNSTTDVDAQIEAFKALEQYENEILPWLPLYYQQVFVVQSDRLDRAGAPYGNEQFNYDWDIVNWDIEPEDGKKIMRTNGGPAEFFETPLFNPGFYMSTKILFDHLIVADENLSPKKGQLADYTVSEDGLTIEFTLKDGIKWHDGDPITAEDVKYTFEFGAKITSFNSVFSNTVQCLEGYQDYIDGKEDNITGIAIDGNKITFSFAKIDPNALLTFSQMPPLPKKYLVEIDPLNFQQADFWQHPVGSGPFKLKEVSMNDYAVFVPFEGYHGGVAKIEEIYMYPSGESDPNLVKNASAGQVDYAYTKSVEDVAALEEVSQLTITPVDIRYTRLFFINKFIKPSIAE